MTTSQEHAKRLSGYIRDDGPKRTYNELADLYGEEYLFDYVDIEPCDVCGGDGGVEIGIGADPSGPVTKWSECAACKGTGNSRAEQF